MPPAPLSDDEVVTMWGLVVEGFTATTARLRADLDAEVAVPLGWLEVLLRLLRTPGHRLGMGALAQQSAITTGGFTRMADRMTAAGLVERQPCGSDRRVIWVSLTPAGIELAERARTVHAAHLRTHVVQLLGATRASDLAESMRVLRGGAAGTVDTSTVDTGTVDTGTVDTGTVDTEFVETEFVETGIVHTAYLDDEATRPCGATSSEEGRAAS